MREEVTDLKNEKKDLESKLSEERKLRLKRESELLEARRELEENRRRFEE